MQNTPQKSAELFKQALNRNRALDELVIELQRGLKSPVSSGGPSFMQKGYARTAMQGSQVMPTMYQNPQYMQKLGQQLSNVLHEKAVTDAAMKWHSMNMSDDAVRALIMQGMPQVATSAPPNLAARAANLGGPIATLLELLTYSPELNTGEEEALARARSMPPTITR